MQKNKGFSLIELVAVIVVLGIIAVTAVPKFMNVQNDAKNATVHGLKSALNSAMSISYGKAAIAGIESSPEGTIEINNEQIKTRYGYPEGTLNGIAKTINYDLDKWNLIETPGARKGIIFVWKNGPVNNITQGCTVQYLEANEDTPASLIVDKDACKLPLQTKA
ncbi:type II secretion system protein [Photobacterium leiognathi]|uniref:type II secretion system protein n=1 Tax=Photobacterium leiognathi TaxID=553611 RepID=UPI0023DEEE91|nr:type II secretion system protein [Photobacterium leiognathi]MCG3884491.1 type II secretion system protein [Photobacterium leiognathi]